MNELEPILDYPQFDMLEHAMTEPRIARVENMVRIYNELLVTEDVDADDAMVIIKELNREWGPLYHTPVEVSGGVYVSDLEGTATLADCEDMTFLSEGFMFFSEEDEDSTVLIRPRIVHRLLLPLDESVRERTGHSYTSAAGDIDKIIVKTSLASTERSLAWLSVFQPDLIEDIDARILNGNGSEVESIMALQSIAFRLDTDDDELGRSCIRTYLESVLECDQTVPYGVTVEGNIFLRLGENSFMPIPMNESRMLGYIRGIVPLRDSDGNYELAAELTQVGRNRTVEGNTLLVPLEAIKGLISVRDTYYAS